MRNRDGGPDAASIRTVKLLKYLMMGHSVEIEGQVYFLESIAKKGQGATVYAGTPVDSMSMEQLKELAEGLEGKAYNEVMNFKVVLS